MTRMPSTENNLSLHPVSKEFHYERNTPLKPEDFTLKSNKKIWWICDKGHEWEAKIQNRTSLNRGCSYCSGQKPSKENNLSLSPVAKEFHYERNAPLKPEDFTLRSNKKIWWKCEKGHEWEARISSRTRGNNCPYCRGYYSSKENNLSLHPASKEFNYERNAPLNPEDFTLGSDKKIWWRCSKDPNHEWKGSINNIKNGRRCPYCSGKKPSKENNLSLHPISKEFHYERNAPLKPEDFTLGSTQKIWWICDKGHEWEANIFNRTKVINTGCPTCSHSGTSKSEQEVLDYIKSIYDGEIIHRHKIDCHEADIYLSDKNLAIEFNGLRWHSSLFKPNDYHYTKYKYFEEKGIQLYYIWEDQWNFCREEIEDILRNLIFDNNKISFKEETCFYTDFRFVSKFRRANMVELHGYGSWEIINGK